MRARIGDEIMVQSRATGTRHRDGEIVGLRHADSSPPYDVRWADTGRVTLLHPGPDARIRPRKQPEEPPGCTDYRGTETDPAPPGSDFGHRVLQERRRLGLSRTEVADRAGMADEYLTYLEQQPANPSSTTVLSLAAALETTPDALRDAGTERAPGTGRAAHHPRLRELGPEECLRCRSGLCASAGDA